MSEQVPTITDTTARQPVDSEAVSSTADTAGRFILGPPVSVHGCLRMRSGYKTSRRGLVLHFKHALKDSRCRKRGALAMSAPYASGVC